MEEYYNQLAVGKRIKTRRKIMGLSREEVSRKIGRAPKYYADIERGSCGMSIGTIMALAKVLNLSLDYIVYGDGKGT